MEGRRSQQPPPQYRSVPSLQEPHLTPQVTEAAAGQGRAPAWAPTLPVLWPWGSPALGEFGSCSAQVASESLGHPVLLLWGTRVILQQLRACPAVLPVVVATHLWVCWTFP